MNGEKKNTGKPKKFQESDPIEVKIMGRESQRVYRSKYHALVSRLMFFRKQDSVATRNFEEGLKKNAWPGLTLNGAEKDIAEAEAEISKLVLSAIEKRNPDTLKDLAAVVEFMRDGEEVKYDRVDHTLYLCYREYRWGLDPETGEPTTMKREGVSYFKWPAPTRPPPRGWPSPLVGALCSGPAEIPPTTTQYREYIERKLSRSEWIEQSAVAKRLKGLGLPYRSAGKGGRPPKKT